MPRARNIKPGFFVNEDLVELPFETRLLFAGLWTLADREGRLEDRPKKIKMAIFPADDVDVHHSLQLLHNSRLIIRYLVEDKGYIQVIKFANHQNPHIKEAASVIPAPDGHDANTVLATPLTSSLIPESLSSDKEEEKEEEGAAIAAVPRAAAKATRIPDPFPITPEMWAWLAEENVEIENVNEAHDEWIEYWTNCTTARAIKPRWDLAWRKGMKKAAKWQKERKANGTDRNGNGPDRRNDADKFRDGAEYLANKYAN